MGGKIGGNGGETRPCPPVCDGASIGAAFAPMANRTARLMTRIL